jgi:hypothetical protein
MVIRVGFLEQGRLKQINFEASVDLPAQSSEKLLTTTPSEAEAPQTQDDYLFSNLSASDSSSENQTMKKLYTCIDALGGIMEEYFQLKNDEDLDFPLRWQPYDFEGEKIYLQHSTINSRLEEEANRLLGLIDDQLVHDQSGVEKDSEDALANAAIDNELAFEVQKVIRAGKHPLQTQDSSNDESDLIQ